jgi:hypothetical protein
MQRKLLGIVTVDFNTSQLLIIYSAFLKYVRKKMDYKEAVHHLFIDFNTVYDSVRREVLYNIIIEFWYCRVTGKANKMCLNETCNRFWGVQHLSDMFPVRNGWKQGDTLSPLLFNFALEYVIRIVQINQDGLKLNGTHQLLVYADDINILGGSVHTLKKHTSFVSRY